MKYWVLLLLVLFALPLSSKAQWQIVVPNANAGGNLGAMCFRDGRTWVAKDGILMSDDSGATWSRINPLPTAYDLQFLDRLNGIAACSNGVYTTADGGRTWRLFSVQAATAACFVGSPLVVALAGQSGTIDITTDGGNNWNRIPQAGYSFYITTMRDRSIIYFAGTSAGGYLYRSTDLGFSWQQSTSFVDWDSFTFGLDSCEANRIYVSNEDAVAPTDQFSQIFLTSDLGATWTAPIARPLNFFTGSVAVSQNAVYCPTVAAGIYRSTDRGQNWKSIKGPNSSYDTRMIVAINDNIVIAVDELGNVWRTLNSGGDLVNSNVPRFDVQPSPASIPDTVQACASASMGLHLVGICGPPDLNSVRIDGLDSINFVATRISSDSVNVLFLPTGSKSYSAQLHVISASGAEQIVPLSAIGAAPPAVAFTTADVSNDTIGGSIYVSIFSSSRTFVGSVDLSIRYDTTNLVYLGGYAASGVQDITTDRFLGVAHLHFANAAATMKDSLLGQAHFLIFPKNAACTAVTIDSIAIMSNARVCALTQSPIVSSVCGKFDCGTPTLSSFIRYNKMPNLSIVPNPATGTAAISSTAELGQVTIEVFDALGNIVDRVACNLSPSRSAILRAGSYSAGAYHVRIITASASYSLNLLHLH